MPDLAGELRRIFGFHAFLPGQEEIVRAALSGRDTLALMPTGSGKSLPYQLAAALRPSPTLVVSPLIALMKDQVDKLPPAIAARATLVNSSLDAAEARRRLDQVAAGRISLLYAAPERLRQSAFVSLLARAGVGLVVVDEAHCVTLWGHDFRPDYLFIRAALRDLGEPPVLALTATATPETEREIGRSLGRQFEVVRASVVRPNLEHAVEHAEGEEERRRALLARVSAADGPAIVYARSRKKCEELSRLLCGHGVRARHYHAGLPAEERTAVQEAFLRGDTPVVVATTAFGMGIDKPDIRLVLLYNFPGSLEDYVQMVGRAGRDGHPSACVLLGGRRDALELRRFVRADVPSLGLLRSVYQQLRARAEGGVATAAPEEVDAGDTDVRVLVGMLEQAGLVRRDFDIGRSMRIELPSPPADAAERIRALLERAERHALARVDGIVRYADAGRCRQELIAAHFGEAQPPGCGRCDSCAGARTPASAPAEAPLPDDPAAAILDAVARLRWPLGRAGLAAMLAGSVSAPPSARRNPAYGVLAAAPASTIKRWLRRLEESGHLEAYESPDGFRLLQLGATSGPPPRLVGAEPAAAPDGPLVERLRSWRRERARSEEIPAFRVFSDRTLRALAAAQPRDEDELSAVPGIGPARLERYGAELLGVLRARTAPG